MALTTEQAKQLFQDKVDLVDPTKTLVFTLDAGTHQPLEWSYSGLTITAGSQLALQYGASELLEQMGFRFYAPSEQFHVLPATIPTGLTAAKQQFWMPGSSIFLVYGHSWGGPLVALREPLTNSFERWQILNGLRTSAFPAGHRWGNIVTSNLAYFQANPQLILNAGTALASSSAAAKAHFDLSVTGADYDNLVMICAAQLLRDTTRINEFNRTGFDPSDGDDWSSDDVFGFTSDVVTQMRAGTSPIGGIPAQAANPTIAVGLYAYAGHRLPPSIDVAPGVYTQVATAFNQTGLTYVELMQGHGAKVDFLGIREYLDTQVWSDSKPLINGRAKSNYFDVYDDYHSAGARGTNCEFGANWLVNIVQMRMYLRKIRTGTCSFADARNDVVGDLFGDDPDVHAIYNYWYDPAETFNTFSLRRSFDIIAAMTDSWYKTYFQQYVTIIKEDRYLPAKMPGDPEDQYPAAISQMLKHITGIAAYDIMHCYAFIRQRANTNLDEYPTIKWGTQPPPDWFANPQEPTEAEFDAAYAELQADTVRDADLDSTDNVLVTGIVPRVAPTAAATKFRTVGSARFMFVGPGNVYVTEVGGGTVETFYNEGPHVFVVQGTTDTTCAGGYLFLDSFPETRKDSDGTARNHWLYIPWRMEGIVAMEADSRVRFYDQNGMLNLLRETAAEYVSPANLGPGQIRIDNVNTRGKFRNYSGCRYISMIPSVALIPRVIALEDFPNLCRIQVT